MTWMRAPSDPLPLDAECIELREPICCLVFGSALQRFCRTDPAEGHVGWTLVALFGRFGLSLAFRRETG
jgi:hypothetical protein